MKYHSLTLILTLLALPLPSLVAQDKPFFMQVQLHGGKICGASAAKYEQTEKRMAAEFGSATDPASVKLPPY